MSLTFVILRHAKSDWTDPFQDDHDRALNSRGRAAALAMGKWLADQGLTIDLALCSTATRARETWDLTGSALPQIAEAMYLPALYLASAQTLLDVLRKNGRGGTVAMIGHNPGIGQMAEMVLRAPPDAQNFRRYPTCYATIAKFDQTDWRLANWRSASLVAHTGPRDL